MRLRLGRTLIAAAAMTVSVGTVAYCDAVEGVDLVVNDEITLVTRTAPAASLDGALPEVLSGWLFRESPSLNVVEHPVYDVWVKNCAMRWPGDADSASPAAKPSGAPSGTPAPAASASPAAAPAPAPAASPAA